MRVEGELGGGALGGRAQVERGDEHAVAYGHLGERHRLGALRVCQKVLGALFGLERAVESRLGLLKVPRRQCEQLGHRHRLALRHVGLEDLGGERRRALDHLEGREAPLKAAEQRHELVVVGREQPADPQAGEQQEGAAGEVEQRAREEQLQVRRRRSDRRRLERRRLLALVLLLLLAARRAARGGLARGERGRLLGIQGLRGPGGLLGHIRLQLELHAAQQVGVPVDKGVLARREELCEHSEHTSWVRSTRRRRSTGPACTQKLSTPSTRSFSTQQLGSTLIGLTPLGRAAIISTCGSSLTPSTRHRG